MIGRFFRFVFTVAILIVLFGGGLVAGIVSAYSRNLPDITKMADFQPSRSTQVYARDGSLLANLYRQNRIWVSINKVPWRVRDAFIATEDRNFYHHHGVDPVGIVRAALADYRHEQLQGASTITQQVARGLFLSNERSFSRKIQEALLALEIERAYTKNEILERYLNLIYFGAGAYGIQSASHVYFGRDVSTLTLPQAAMLAGLPAAPSDYSPYVDLGRAKERQSHVLDRMAASGYITQGQADAAKKAPLGLIGYKEAGLDSYSYPYFTTFAVHSLEDRFGTQATYEDGLQVITTIDPRMQKLAQEAISYGMGQASAGGIGADEAALVAIKPSTGEILAMVGGAEPFSVTHQFNRAWQARRQPGSSFKAYVYTAAIDQGMTPISVIDDSAVSYPMGDGTQWSPQDDDHRFYGPVTLRWALAQSRNVVAVKLLQQIGVDKVIEYAKRMGVNEPLEANLSLALGTSVVTPLDMATGYSTLANAGVHVKATSLRMVKDSIGSTLLDQTYPEEEEVVSAGTAYVVTSMLEGVIQHGTGYPNAVIDRPAAGKTGTASDFRDAWFVGYTPDLVTAVWVGNDDNHPMRESYGGDVPAKIWARFMKTALEKTPKHDFPFPTGEVKRVGLCDGSGQMEVFLTGTEPARDCAPRRERVSSTPPAVLVDPGSTNDPAVMITPSASTDDTSTQQDHAGAPQPVRTKPSYAQPAATDNSDTSNDGGDPNVAPDDGK
jgi:penicillin-binding protein 1A